MNSTNRPNQLPIYWLIGANNIVHVKNASTTHLLKWVNDEYSPSFCNNSLYLSRWQLRLSGDLSQQCAHSEIFSEQQDMRNGQTSRLTILPLEAKAIYESSHLLDTLSSSTSLYQTCFIDIYVICLHKQLTNHSFLSHRSNITAFSFPISRDCSGNILRLGVMFLYIYMTRKFNEKRVELSISFNSLRPVC